jgi:hypothetical protein
MNRIEIRRNGRFRKNVVQVVAVGVSLAWTFVRSPLCAESKKVSLPTLAVDQ